MGENTAVFNAATLDAGITISSTVAPDGGGASYLWLGGTDRLAEGTWIWDGTDSGSGDQFWEGTSASTGGTSVGGLYNNWGDEPDDFGSGQDGLGLAITDWPLGTAGQWNDVATSNSLYYVIEYIDQSSIDENNRGSFKIFPNPTNDQIQFQFTEGVIFKKAVIYSVDGKVVLESSSPQVDVRNLESGTYRVMILFEDGKTSTETFVK